MFITVLAHCAYDKNNSFMYSLTHVFVQLCIHSFIYSFSIVFLYRSIVYCRKAGSNIIINCFNIMQPSTTKSLTTTTIFPSATTTSSHICIIGREIYTAVHNRNYKPINKSILKLIRLYVTYVVIIFQNLNSHRKSFSCLSLKISKV